MTEIRAHRGPWTHRFLVHLFSVVLAVLVYWLLGFVMDDIGDWAGPDYDELEQRMLDPPLVAMSRTLIGKTADAERRIADERARQEILRDSTNSSRETMNQLLEIQRLSLQKSVTPTAEEQKSLAESEALFLGNQKRYQEINEEIARLNEQLREHQEQRRGVEQSLEEQRKVVRREFEQLQRRHNLRVATAKLAALTPLLLVAVWLFLKRRSSLYAPMIYAFGVAVLLKVGAVMHEYFPTRYFKYVLILAFLGVVVRALTSLLRMIAHPKADWLLKQYREAYETFFCPVCDYPIRRGPLKYLSWTRRSIRRLILPATTVAEPDQPYTCPMCGTHLFEECPACHSIRHSLLPACTKCGTAKAVSEEAAVAGPGEEP